MKKLPLIMGTAITVCALGATATVIPSWNSVVFAANASIGTTDPATAQKNLGELMSEVDAKFPEVENWSNVSTAINVIERGNGCSGKGCNSEGALRNTIEPALTSAGTDFSSMDVFGKLAAAKAITGYDSNDTLKEAVGKVEADINLWIYGDTNNPDSTGVVKSLPSSFNKDSIKDKTPKEIIQIVKAAPNFDKYIALSNAISAAAGLTNGSTIEQLTQAYDNLYKAYVALGGSTTSAVAPAPTLTPAQSELQKYVDSVKKTDEYKKAKALVDAVRYLDALIAMANGESGRGGMGAAEPAQKVDQPYVAYAMPARAARTTVAVTVDPALAKELAEAIKAVGDAMRALGISTNLGQGMTSATLDEATAAFAQAKKVNKFSAYVELVDAIADAEAAIASGSTDVANLKKLLEAVKTASTKVLPPDTGVAVSANADAAHYTVSILAAVATTLTAAGAALVIRRQLIRKAQKN